MSKVLKSVVSLRNGVVVWGVFKTNRKKNIIDGSVCFDEANMISGVAFMSKVEGVDVQHIKCTNVKNNLIKCQNLKIPITLVKAHNVTEFGFYIKFPTGDIEFY